MEQQNLPAVVTPEVLSAELKTILPEISERSKRGVLALSKITAINTPEEDKIANDLLVRARATIEGGEDKATGNAIPGIVERRKEITSGLDQMKKALLVPENLLNAEMERVRNLRNAFTRKQLEAEQQREAEIQQKKKEQNEIARVTALIKSNIVEASVGAVQSLNKSIQSFIDGMTLENWDEKIKVFSVRPALKKTVYESAFQVEFDASAINADIFEGIKAEVAKAVPFEQVNAEYITAATPIVKDYADGLDALKGRLQKIADLKENNALAAAVEQRRLDEEKEKQNTRVNTTLNDAKTQKLEEVKAEQDEARISAEFASQIETQSTAAPAPKGLRKTRVALIEAPPERLAVVASKIMHFCLSHPKFEGTMKYKKGVPVGNDKDGFPVYADWLAPLLNFVAAEAEEPIEGVKFDQRTTTTATK